MPRERRNIKKPKIESPIPNKPRIIGVEFPGAGIGDITGVIVAIGARVGETGIVGIIVGTDVGIGVEIGTEVGVTTGVADGVALSLT